MESLLMVLVLIYVFATGFFAVRILGNFVRRNPGSFSGSQKGVIVPPLFLQDYFDDDSGSGICYNDCTNSKEHGMQ